MIESVYIVTLIFGILFFILGYEDFKNRDDPTIYSGISIVIWLIVFVDSFAVQVPGIAIYQVSPINAIAMIFFSLNILLIIIHMIRKPLEERNESILKIKRKFMP